MYNQHGGCLSNTCKTTVSMYNQHGGCLSNTCKTTVSTYNHRGGFLSRARTTNELHVEIFLVQCLHNQWYTRGFMSNKCTTNTDELCPPPVQQKMRDFCPTPVQTKRAISDPRCTIVDLHERFPSNVSTTNIRDFCPTSVQQISYEGNYAPRPVHPWITRGISIHRLYSQWGGRTYSLSTSHRCHGALEALSIVKGMYVTSITEGSFVVHTYNLNGAPYK